MLKQSVQKCNASGATVIPKKSSFSAPETDNRNVRILQSKADEAEQLTFIKNNISDELKIVQDKTEKMEQPLEGVSRKVKQKSGPLFVNSQPKKPLVLPTLKQIVQKNTGTTSMPITLPPRISSNITILSCPITTKARYEEPSPYVTIEKKPTSSVGQLLVNSSQTKQAVVYPKLGASLQKVDTEQSDNKTNHSKPAQSLLKSNQNAKRKLSVPIINKTKSISLLKCNQEDLAPLSPRNQRSKSLTSTKLNKLARKLSSSSDCGTNNFKTTKSNKNDFKPIKLNISSHLTNNADEDSPLVVDAADFEKMTEGKTIESCSVNTSESSVLLCDENVDKDSPTPNSGNDSIKSIKNKFEELNKSKASTKASPTSLLKSNIKNELSMLTWSNGIAKMNYSNLAFEMNEFSLLEVHENHIFRDRISVPYEQPLSKRKTLTNITDSSDPLYLCRSCNCHGAAVDFLAPFFCSVECANRLIRKKRQGRFIGKVLDSQDQLQQQRGQAEATLLKRRSARKATHNVNPIPEKNNYKLENIDKSLPTKAFQWGSYLREQNGKMAIVNLFLNPFPSDSNHFEIGMKLEAIDPENNSLFCVCSIVEKRGFRLKLHFDGYRKKFDFWVNADSMDIFPPGWCSKTERILQPPREMNMLSFNWPAYLNKCNAIPAPRQLFTHLKSSSTSNPFKIGMKLEAEDLKNTRKVCVASVIDVLDNRILIRFDGWSERYDYWVDISSPYIFPVGWHNTQGLKIVPPADFNVGDFSWPNYLELTNSVAADEKFFRTREPIKFECGMKLEVVDKKNPILIRPATILIVDDYELKILFDGWPETFAFWTPDDSPDIHPVGWCELTSHDLEPPPGYDSILPLTMPCPIKGCRGIGNAKKSEIDFHATAESCPYEINNWTDETEKPSRLDDIEKPSVCFDDIIPLSINKKRKSITQNEEVEVEPLIKQIKRESISISPEPSENVNVDLPIMVAKRFLCDYGPRLKQNYDIWYKNSKWLRKTIAGITDKNPLKWTVDETALYIEALPSCNSIAEIFRHNEIDGEALLSMCQADLTTHLKLNIGPAMKIFSLITNLRGDVVQFHRH